jgi:transposase
VIELLREGISRGASAKAIAGLFGLATRTLRRWGLMIRSEGLSGDRRKGVHRYVAHRFSREEREIVLETVIDSRFADLTPSQIVAILAEEGLYVGSESTIYRILRQEGLLNHRGRSRPPREPREPPVLEATGIHQVLAWDITLLPLRFTIVNAASWPRTSLIVSAAMKGSALGRPRSCMLITERP